MTAMEAVREFDALQSNGYSQEQKLRWLDRLDGFIQRSVLDRYPARRQDFTGGDPDRVLLMEDAFAEGYLHWLAAKVHYYNQEPDRYNAAVGLFRGIFEDYQRELNRRQVPEQAGDFRL